MEAGLCISEGFDVYKKAKKLKVLSKIEMPD